MPAAIPTTISRSAIAGEACGAFRTLDAPEVIDINGDRANLDFISGYPVNLFNSSIGPASLGTRPIDISGRAVTQSKEARAQ